MLPLVGVARVNTNLIDRIGSTITFSDTSNVDWFGQDSAVWFGLEL